MTANKVKFKYIPISSTSFEQEMGECRDWNKFDKIQFKLEDFFTIRGLKDGNGRLYLDLMEDGKYYLFGKEIEVV